MTKSRC